MEDPVVFYFAYGSDMNPETMNIRQISFSERKPGKLSGYEFVLNKKRVNGTAGANIRPKENSCVHGILYSCTLNVLNKLDKFENASSGVYSRKIVTVLNESGDDIEAHTYISDSSACNDNLKIVSKEYLDHILCGGDLLPENYLNFLKTFKSWAVHSCPSEDYYLTEAANETEE